MSLCFSHISWASDSIILPDASFDLQITPYLSILEDTSNTLTIEDILTAEKQLKFSPNNSEKLRFNLSDSSFWLRFSITNPHLEKQSLVFSISNNRLDEIHFYEYKSGKLLHIKSGSISPHKAKGSHRQAYPFLINASPKSNQTYFVRIQSSTAIDTTFRLQSDDQFLQSQQLDFTILGFALGLVMATAVFFLFIWYFYRFKIAVISAWYCISILIFIPAWLGQWAIWFPHTQHLKDEITLVSIMLSVIFQTLIILELKWKKPNARIVVRTLRVLLIVNIIATIFLLFLPADSLVFLAQLLIAVSCGIMALVLIFGKSRYQHSTKFLLLGLSFIVPGIIASLLTSHDYLALNFLSTWVGLLLPIIMVVSTLFFNVSFINQYRKTRQQQNNNSDHLLPKVLAKLGHEFRTPINGVTGMSELLSDTHLTHTQRDYLDTINLAGEDLLTIVNEMSDFAKLQSDGITLINKPFDLSNCLTQCMERYQQEAKRKKIELVLDISDDISARLQGDENRLKTIISNLVSQSLRHTESGELELSVFRVGAGKQEGIFFQIQLTGSLIEHDELRHLFRTMDGPTEPFKNSNIDQNLGLIIVKRLVALMHGSIEVETLTTQGCSITLFLPIKEVFTKEVAEPENSAILSGKRILIVDDNSTFRGVIEKQTRRWGMKADNTNNGKEALALMRNKTNLDEPYDYIIIDQDMPMMSGLQLTTRLMSDDEIMPKPIRIMLTGLGINSSNQEAIDAGMQKVINKPISGKDLKEALLELS